MNIFYEALKETLVESKLDDAVRKYHLTPDQRYLIHDIDPRDRLHNKYTDWLARHVKELPKAEYASRDDEPHPDIYEHLRMFHMTGEKIDKFNSWNELAEFVENKRGFIRDALRGGKRNKDLEIIEDNADYKLMHVKTFDAMNSMYEGNTGWCVANDGGFWDDYTANNAFFVVEAKHHNPKHPYLWDSPYAIAVYMDNPTVEGSLIWNSSNIGSGDDPDSEFTPADAFSPDDKKAIEAILKKNWRRIMTLTTDAKDQHESDMIKKDTAVESVQGYFHEILLEGGAGGHLYHPYQLTGTGADLINFFQYIASNLNEPDYVKNNVSVKVDGVNAMFKLVHDGTVQFALDRGSGKALDVHGVTADKIKERFGGARPLYFNALNMLNRLLPFITTNLKELGIESENQTGFNCDVNMPGTTNVVKYATQYPFITIHDIVRMEAKPESKKGARIAVPVQFDGAKLKDLAKVMDGLAQKRGWRVFSGVSVRAKDRMDITAPLKRTITIGKESKTLQKWISDITIDPKQVNIANYTKIVSKEAMSKPELDGALIFLANMLIGQHILANLKSETFDDNEGIVVTDPKIKGNKVKITGNFMVKRLDSPFKNESVLTEAFSLMDEPGEASARADKARKELQPFFKKYGIPEIYSLESIMTRLCSNKKIPEPDMKKMVGIISEGIDLNEIAHGFDKPFLMLAISWGNLTTVRALLEAGADSNVGSVHDTLKEWKPLAFAQLRKRHADPTEPSGYKSWLKYSEMEALLKQHGAHD